MAWWQAALTFAGIPALLFGVITVIVTLTSHPRVPDGIAAAAKTDAKRPTGQSSTADHDR